MTQPQNKALQAISFEMADRESGIYFEILHMEYRAGTSEFGKKTGGRDKKCRLNAQDNVWPLSDDFPEGHPCGCQGKAERRKEAPNPAHFGAQRSGQRRILTPARVSLA